MTLLEILGYTNLIFASADTAFAITAFVLGKEWRFYAVAAAACYAAYIMCTLG